MNKQRKFDMSKFACSTFIIGKNATVDGSVIVSHSDDDVDDERLIYVPARKWNLSDPAQNMRNVYYDNASLGSNQEYNSTDIRRYIGNDRGPGYQTQSEGYADSKPIGKIPQVAETYAYFDCNYGVMNEHNLMMGECTCGAKFQPDPENNRRLFYASELSRVALERCKTAREAILLMGQLLMKYGYYGTGETLTVGDANEGWVFEMCAYRADDPSGIWVAQRVPDNHLFVEANQFRIRDIKRNHNDKMKADAQDQFFQSDDPDNIIWYSPNLFYACQSNKWIEPEATELDWAATVSTGEYSHPYYSLRRVWRALSLANPSLHLQPEVADGYTKDYPFSIVPAKNMSVLDLVAIHRDQYQGTEFDLTQGIAAGPFGNPVRYDTNPDQGDTFNLNTYHPDGAWERPISIYRCGILWINQTKTVNRKDIGISWIGLDRPAANCLMPFSPKTPDLPKPMQTMNILDFQFRGDSAWWAFNFVANYLNLNYQFMSIDLGVLQKQLEEAAYEKISKVISTGVTDDLIPYCNANMEKVVKAWWDLATKLIVTYNNGCMTTDATSVMQKINYPKKWLKLVGYYDGPIKY